MDVECAISPGLPSFATVGLPDKAFGEAIAIGELTLDCRLNSVIGALSAALKAAKVIATPNLLQMICHLRGLRPIKPARQSEMTPLHTGPDLRKVKGQKRAKRARGIAVAGRHHMLMVGAPESGKSVLAARLPRILPPLSPVEALESSMVYSLAGLT